MNPGVDRSRSKEAVNEAASLKLNEGKDKNIFVLFSIIVDNAFHSFSL